MALEARLNLVLRLLVGNGLREITGRYRLFGNVGPDFSDASGSIRVLSCSCERV